MAVVAATRYVLILCTLTVIRNRIKVRVGVGAYREHATATKRRSFCMAN